MKGSLDKARAEFEPLQKAFPRSPTVATLAAEIQSAGKQTEAARATYAKTLQESPDNLEALAGMIRIDLATGRSAQATTLIESRLSTTQPPVAVLLLAARTYAAVEHWDKAEAVLHQAIDADPSRLQAYELLGQLYVSQNRLTDAEARYRDTLQRYPKSVSANTMLAMIIDEEGRPSDAEKQYERVLAMDPNAAVAANNLACIYLATNQKLDEALRLAQMAHQRLPDDPHINDTLGWIYYGRKMASTGVQFLEASVREAPSDAIVQFHLGMAYVQTGDWEKARRALRQASQLKPDFDGVEEARKALVMIGR
jgi:tetratricopeptide (TPR) repeat protein